MNEPRRSAAAKDGETAGDVLLVLSNLPDEASARALAAALIGQRAAACVNVLAVCTSVYRWQEKVETASEVPVLMKTTRAAYPRLEKIVRELHPYELPELIAVPVEAGLPAYLGWVGQETEEP